VVLTADPIPLVDLKSPMEGIDVLFIFGVDEGTSYRSLSSFLKKEETRFLVFITENEEALFKAKQCAFARDPKVRICYWKRGEEAIFQELAWEFVFLRFGYAALQPGEMEAAGYFFAHLEHYHRGVDLLASDCEDMGLKVLKNGVENLKVLPRSRLGQALEGKCKGIPAIICGAGPSLNQAIPYLNQLKEKALLIAGGSAIRALNAQGISPHFSAHLDPAPPRDRFLEQDTHETPFFYQGRFSHDLLTKVHGPLFWMAAGGSYPLEEWMAAECGLFSERFDAGWTVSNFCTAIAAHLGCSSILFVGMDLSCGPDALYASGVKGEENREALIELEPGKLYSKRDWMMSAEWTGAFAKKHSEIEWGNATEGGIDLPGIERKNLLEWEKSLPDAERDLSALVSALTVEAPLTPVSLEKVSDVKRKVRESFEKSLELCDALLKVWEKHYPHSPLEKGEYALLQSDLEQEICHAHFLLPLWNVWRRPILRTSFHPLGQHLHRLLFFKKAIETHLAYLRDD